MGPADVKCVHLLGSRPPFRVLKNLLYETFKLGCSDGAADLAGGVLDLAVFLARMNLLLQRNDSAGQPVGNHADSHQTESLELADSISTGLDDGGLSLSRLLDPRAVVLGESANEGWQAGLVVLVVESLSVPALERGLQRKGEEISVSTGLNTDSAHHMAVGGAQLVKKK
jgi:hypothetical protein